MAGIKSAGRKNYESRKAVHEKHLKHKHVARARQKMLLSIRFALVAVSFSGGKQADVCELEAKMNNFLVLAFAKNSE